MRDRTLQEFLDRLATQKKKIVTIYLFGSRARGQERPDSDYDLLLVVREDFSLKDKGKIYDVVLDILLKTGRLISLKIFRQVEFDRLSFMGTPFTTNVLREGIKIG